MRKNVVTKLTRRGTLAVLAIVVVGLVLTAEPGLAHATTYTETTLYSFCSQSNCTDGKFPWPARLISDAKGNLYGTTEGGGDLNGCSGYGCGVVFKLSRTKQGQWKETLLYSFTGGADGGSPFADVIFDAKGDLYGTTYIGGASGNGVVFKVHPNGTKSTETVLYSFGGSDGANPAAGVIFDAKGNLFGTTYYGGASGNGVVFKVHPNGTKSTETVLHTFTGGDDGANPEADLILDANGNLYGTTFNGGASGYGVVFKVHPNGTKSTETVLHTFTGGADGAYPEAGLIFDAKGNLYGGTAGGGYSQGFAGEGVVFKLRPEGTKSTETVLYSFTGGDDGGRVQAPLIFDAKGNLYGTTNSGGPCFCGVVFKVRPEGTNSKETVLYSFTGGADGAEPVTGVVFDAKGNLYGATSSWASNTPPYGAVYELSPTAGQRNFY